MAVAQQLQRGEDSISSTAQGAARGFFPSLDAKILFRPILPWCTSFRGVRTQMERKGKAGGIRENKPHPVPRADTHTSVHGAGSLRWGIGRFGNTAALHEGTAPEQQRDRG